MPTSAKPNSKRQPALTVAQVAVAVANIQAEGRSPTLRAVLAELGSGSMRTVGKLVKQVLSDPEAVGHIESLTQQLIATETPVEQIVRMQGGLQDAVQATVAASNEMADLVLVREAQAAEMEAMATEIVRLTNLQHARAGKIRQRTAELRADIEKTKVRAAELRQTIAELKAATTDDETGSTGSSTSTTRPNLDPGDPRRSP